MASGFRNSTGILFRCRWLAAGGRATSIASSLVIVVSLAGDLTADQELARDTERDKVAAPTAFAVGDVHGDYDAFRLLLERLELVDADDNWIGGTTRLIQTGDLLDRGSDSRRVMDLLIHLEEEAPRAGGSVVVLLGNHEIFNLLGDLRYVSRGEFDAFADEETAASWRQRASDALAIVSTPSPLLRSSYYRRLSRTVNTRSARKLFPSGYFAHRDAFAPTGRYGRWLLKKPALHRDNRILFVHGGISRTYAGVPYEELNRATKELLAKYFAAVKALEEAKVYDRALGHEVLVELAGRELRAGADERLQPHFAAVQDVARSLLLAEDGPFMYRGLAVAPERALSSVVKTVLRTNDVERIMIGHTRPPDLRVTTRFKNRVLLIDTGMNQEFYGGRPSAVGTFPSGTVEIWE